MTGWDTINLKRIEMGFAGPGWVYRQTTFAHLRNVLEINNGLHDYKNNITDLNFNQFEIM